MKTDRYTKGILTVIAICLSFNVAQELDLITEAHATSPNNEPMIPAGYTLVPLGESGAMDVRIVDIATYDELNVNLKSVDTYDEVKVNIKSIDTSDELDVNLDEIGGGWVTNGGPIKVTMQ